MFKWVFIILVSLGGFNFLSAAVDEPDHAIHEELRGVLGGIQNAVNTEHYDQLAQYFHKNMRVTTSNQEVLTSHEDITKFFNFWFGPGGVLKKVEMNLDADALTEFYANKTIGIVRGSGVENCYLSDSRFFPMKTRWTATVIKDDDGKWRILTLHIGINFLDNPVLSVAKESANYFGIIGGVVGLLIGLLIGFFLWRKRKPLSI